MPELKQFLMPDVGEGLEEADIVGWHVVAGDRVSDGQIVVEVETAKALVELPCPFDGVVHEILVPEGRTVAVGAPIITVALGAGEGADVGAGSAAPAPDPDPDPAPAPANGGGGGETAAVPAAATTADGNGGGPTAGRPPAPPREADSATAPGGVPEGDTGRTVNGGDGARQGVLVGYGPRTASATRRPKKTPPPAAPAPASGRPAVSGTPAPLAKPPVRKLARDLGVDLATVPATGPGGVVTREDVHAAARPVPPDEPRTPEREGEPAAAPAGGRRIPVKGVRKATAEAMVRSAFTAPHVTEWVRVDVTRTVKLAHELRKLPDFAHTKVTPLLLVAKALLTAAARHPQINASWDEAAQEIVVHDRVNLGIAAATPRGLLVPNIKDAGSLTLPGLAAALGALAETAREGRTTPADMAGGTLTITNVGVFGVDGGTPILNPGEAAILAFGAIRELPWVHKGKVKPRRVATLSLSFDHRMVDGELGSRVLADVAQMLERPKLLFARS